MRVEGEEVGEGGRVRMGDWSEEEAGWTEEGRGRERRTWVAIASWKGRGGRGEERVAEGAE